MDHIGIRVHKKEGQNCILGEGGELIERRIRTTPERFAAVLGDRPRGANHAEAHSEPELPLSRVRAVCIVETDGHPNSTTASGAAHHNACCYLPPP
jgi:hypothetical protein